eukprot:Tbor_TRINITY_DN4306_c0_g1::TRINITY_DN4306_c0_g1_i2::g.7758::m.7758/K01069/E3.1.2.6, gloB; hydroxyacylglutathione hydrolase
MRKLGQKTFGDIFTVYIVPVLSDNFSYIIHDHLESTIALVDVSVDVKPILSVLKDRQLPRPYCVLTTHKHHDHCGGNQEIVAAFGSGSPMKVYAGCNEKTVPCATTYVKDDEVFNIGSLTVRTLETPCHTTGHVLYHVSHPDTPESALFCGDTLFVGGIGAFFEGTASQMLEAMDKITARLPDTTNVFPGHEYTVSFLKTACTIDTKNEFIRQQLDKYEALVKDGRPTIPSTLKEEKQQNLFMRCHDSKLREIVGKDSCVTSPVDMMQCLYNKY